MIVSMVKLKANEYFKRYTRRCGVLCKGCGWRGYRVVKFDLPLKADLDRMKATNKIKGRYSYPCPKCVQRDGYYVGKKADVVFTHVPGLRL